MEIEAEDLAVTPVLDQQESDTAVNEVSIAEIGRDPSRDPIDITGSLVGLSRKTLKEMHDLYRCHARALGFSVRKSTTRFSIHVNGLVTEKYYCCSCAGFKVSGTAKGTSGSSTSPKRSKQVGVPRTGCKASLRVKLNSEGFYEVVNHVLGHNHAFNRIELCHIYRPKRVMTDEKGKSIEDTVNSEMNSDMSATDSFRYMVCDAENEECIGHTNKDHLKTKAIEGCDAQAVLDMLYDLAAEEEDFFFRIRFDDTGRLCNIFWRDSMMKEDYSIYGDVTIFDTTYRTNRYNLICAPFLGMNNHGKNVMFGCAFLANEKAESFDWLFEVFKQSMAGKCPVSIFTDQDQTIVNAIAKVFPETRHRLCLWQLQQDVAGRFGELSWDSTFKDAYTKCLSGCADENEFESCWRSMITEYGLEEHAWFMCLYDLKDKWSTALSKDFFSIGIQFYRRSESINNPNGFNANKMTTLTELFGIFKETIKRWRSAEEHDELQCSRSVPSSVLPLTGLLKHAAQVYTLTVFRDFEEEFMKSMGTRATVVFVDGNSMVYDISHEDGDCKQRLTFDCANNLCTCSCKKFEESGLLCYHSLRVLHMHSVFEIPERYISKRWTKFAKTEIWDMVNRENDWSDRLKDCSPWVQDMARKYIDLISRCQEHEEARKIIEDGYHRAVLAVDTLLSSLVDTEEQTEESGAAMLVPTHRAMKGRSQKIKGHVQRKKQKIVPATSADASYSAEEVSPN